MISGINLNKNLNPILQSAGEIFSWIFRRGKRTV